MSGGGGGGSGSSASAGEEENTADLNVFVSHRPHMQITNAI